MGPGYVGFTWHPAYHAAVFETEAAQMMGRILEAHAAMEQRLLSPIKKDGQEYRELVDAQNALDVLKREWVDKVARLQN
jgi:hypothetical protein